MDTTTAAWDRCFRKKLFWTHEDAERHMQWLWTMHGANGMEVYPCEIGNSGPHFHVGHAPHSDKKRKLSSLRTYGRQTVLTDK